MTRNIYINVVVQADGKGAYTIVRPGNTKILMHLITLDVKSATPHLQLFKEFRSVNLKKVKAITYELSIKAFPTYSEFYQFRQKCYEFCQTHGIFYFTVRPTFIDGFMAFSQTQTMVNEGEMVTVIKTNMEEIFGITYKREKNGYQCFYSHVPCKFMPTLQWKQDFMNGIQSSKVIFLSSINDKPTEDGGNYLMVGQKTFSYIPQYSAKAVVEMAQHAMGEKISQYNIREVFGINGVVHDDDIDYIVVEHNEILPLEKSVIVDVDHSKVLKYSVYYLPEKPVDTLKQIKLSSFKCKKVKATIKIDVNGFYDFFVEVICDDKLDEKFSKLTVDLPSNKIRITFDNQNFTVFIGDENKEYVMKDSDGLEKTPIYIAFNQKKPLIGKAAKEAYDEKPEFVVYDLIKLCSISSADVMNPRWKFELSKNPESDSIAVTFQSEKGKTKSDVPFLMALILRYAIKRVFKETGAIASELGIGFDGFSPNEMLKKNFVEAGKLMKCNLVFV